jgi:hypothetical protein
MAIRIKFGAQIMNHIWSCGFFSCSGLVSFYAHFIFLERAEKEMRFSMANGTFKMKMNIDCHGPKLMPNNCKNLNPPYFSLPSTFNMVKIVRNVIKEQEINEQNIKFAFIWENLLLSTGNRVMSWLIRWFYQDIINILGRVSYLKTVFAALNVHNIVFLGLHKLSYMTFSSSGEVCCFFKWMIQLLVWD